MTSTLRDQMLARFKASREGGDPILVGDATTGAIARCAEIGGADCLVVTSANRFRAAGHSPLAALLPNGNANETALAIGKDILRAGRQRSVLLGLHACDPFCDIPSLLAQAADLGFTGVHNWPSIGLIDGMFRAHLESAGFTFTREVEMLALAREAGLAAAGCVFDASQAKAMLDANVDVLVCHPGLGSMDDFEGSNVRDHTDRLAEHIDSIVSVVGSGDTIVLAHAASLRSIPDVERLLTRTPNCHGIFGSSLLEELSTELVLISTTRRLKEIRRLVLPANPQNSLYKNLEQETQL